MTSISATDFDYIRELVRRESAIVLDNGKEYLAEARLQPLLRRNQLESFEDLVQLLKGDRSGNLHEAVVDALTTNETSFFRDGHPWESLKQGVLPDLIERRAANQSLTVWCAASSSGQEPYTLAMLLREAFPEIVASWRIRIMATDISDTMLERAQEGMYSQLEVNRGLPAPLLLRYFTRAGLEWQLNKEVRSMVSFSKLNLAADLWPQLPPVDLVFIRNVLIYFDESTKRAILERAHHHLRPDGYLFLGSSETTFNLTDLYARRQIDRTICYQPA